LVATSLTLKQTQNAHLKPRKVLATGKVPFVH